MTITEKDLKHLRLAVDLAREALDAGDAPFGTVLVDADGNVLQTDRNRTVSGSELSDGKPDPTLHPEFTLARWAQLNLSAEARAKATIYTSGEHCAMCAAAHAYCGLGKIFYVSSSVQLGAWMTEAGIDTNSRPIAPLSINEAAPRIPVEGPVPGLDAEVKKLHEKKWNSKTCG